jgi:hypothetical protein
MKISKAITNGLEYLNITSPTFKKTELTKLLSTEDAYYLVDSYVAGIYADKLNHQKLKGKVLLTSHTLSYFTTMNVRDRFTDVATAVKNLNQPYFMIHNEVFNKEPMVDPKKAAKLGKIASVMVSTIKENIGGIVLSIPKNLPDSNIRFFFDNVISVITPDATSTNILFDDVVPDIPPIDILFFAHIDSMEQADNVFGFLKGFRGFMTKKESKLFIQSSIDVLTMLEEKYKFAGEFIQVI